MSQHAFSIKRDPVRVLHDAIEASPGGIKEAAKRLGRSPGVLYNKFSEEMPQYAVSVREAMALAEGLETTVFAEAVAENFGGVFFPLPSGGECPDDLLEGFVDVVHQLGEVCREFKDARRDGIIDAEEYDRIEHLGHGAIASVMRMLAELKTGVREVPASGTVRLLAGASQR